jgi:hypothetical protein
VEFEYTLYNNINKREIWKALQRVNVSKGLMKRIKNIYDKYENSTVIDGKKKNKVFKCLEVLNRKVFYVLCYST